MLVILIAIFMGLAPLQSPKETEVTGLLVCNKIDPPPPDAKHNTTTLNCHRHLARNVDELKPIALEVPDTYATFKGHVFIIELLKNGQRLNPENQPEGSEVHLTGPCPKPRKIGYPREPLQRGPCNPDLKPS